MPQRPLFVASFFRITIAAASFAAVGCRQEAPRRDPAEITKIAALNASPKTGDFVFEAGNSILLRSAPLTVNGGDVGARGTGSGPFLSGGVAVDISTGAVVQTTHNVIADSVRLNSGAQVGDLQVNRLVNPNAGTHGAVTAAVPLPALPTPAAVTPGTTNLTVAGGKTVAASPGQFLTVSLGTGAVLRLAAGTYQMKDLTIGTNGRVEALGTVQIRIANRLNASSGFFIGPASGATLTAKDIRIEVSGVNGTDGALGSTPKAAALGSNGSVRAIVLVPNGTLSFASGICAKGAFLARDMDVGSSNAPYAFEDGFPNGATCTPAGCDDHNPCTTDACGADGACTHTNVAAGTSCTDGNACNGAETCDGAGACNAGTPVTCAASDACHLPGTCNPSTGACSNPPAPSGTSCSDGNACNGAETCDGSGACKAGSAVTCTASDACHLAGTCNPSTGACSNPPAPSGTSCSDGNACNGAETCDGSGTCKSGTPVTCTAADACHVAGMCDPATGACSAPPAPPGTSCSDGDACNGAETCNGAGLCVSGTPVVCHALDVCHDVGQCNPSTGICSNPAKAAGSSCSDGNACNGLEKCDGFGVCQAGTIVTCAAPDACHIAGTCNPSTGACSNPPAPAGTSCSDGNACNGAETCDGSGACKSGAPVVCAASDQCHGPGLCDSATGLCSNPTVPDGTGCSDGNDCTTGDVCQGGSCVGGPSNCASLVITETPGGTSAVAQLGATLAADAAAAVPGDPVTFTAQVTNTGTQLGLGFAQFNVKNTGSAPFVVKGYQQTLEYFSISQAKWIPFAKMAFDADGNPVPITDPTLISLQFGFVQPFFGDNVTYGPGSGVAGTSIAPGGDGNWLFTLPTIVPADVIKIIFDPAESSDIRAAISFDVPAGPPSPPGVADLENAFPGVTGDVNDVAAQLHFPAPDTLDPTGTPMVSTETGALAPGASRAFTVQLPAPAMAPRDPSDTDSHYLAVLAADQLNGYSTYVVATAHAPTIDPPGANGPLHLGLQLPIVTPTKSGPATSNAGLTQGYTVSLANSGAAAAGPFSIVDSVDGAPVAGTTVNAPNVAAGTAGQATLAAPSSLDRPAGPMTDTVAVTWQDRNGNGYGPVSSSFTLTIGPGHPEGYLTIAGGTGSPDMVGTPKTLTVTALDPFGNPVSGASVQLTITGVNPQTPTLTTGANGTASFTYAGPNLGKDTFVATATLTTTPVQSAPVIVNWASSVGTPCTGRGTPLDVLFVIDGSPSMFDGTNVAAAQAASDQFINEMDFSIDQVGTVSFSGGAELDVPLTTDAASAKAATDTALFNWAHACDGFCSGGTNYQAAFQTALTELQSPRHRPAATPVIIFISDGGNTGPDYTAALAALKAAGIHIVSVGMGPSVDANVMRQIATSQNDYFYAPTTTELSWVYSYVNHDLCTNTNPLVSAGGNQGFYEVRLPDLLTLNGEVHDVNGVAGDSRLSSQWTEVSGPAPATFTDASSPVTQVLFTEPGTYVLELSATDGFLNFADRATITVDPAPNLAGASLIVSLATPSPATTGTSEVITATLVDASAAPIGHFPLQLTVAGVNPAAATAITNAAGVATFSYTGTRPGNDSIRATALGPGFTIDSTIVPLQWNDPPTGGPVLTQGWIASPLNQSTITGRAPIILTDTVTLTSGTLSYWPDTRPTEVHTLATGLAVGPGSTMATLDTTLLANGSYVISLDGVDDTNNERQSFVLVTVAGEYKPGRLVVEVTDLTIPIAGLPITVGRRYDSLEKDRVSDFGNGWSLTVGSPRLEVDRGHNVTMTMPNGRRSTFAFTPSPPVIGGGPIAIILGYMLIPAYTPVPGVFGTLTQDDCSVIFLDPFAEAPELRCLDTLFGGGSLDYAPTEYTYTDPYGRQFVMGATGELRSIKDLRGNTLTFQPNGIISSAGRTVTFARDAQGRITKVVTPPITDFFGATVEWNYAYDAAGNLESATAPGSGTASVTHYTYDTGHRLLTTKDPRGNLARTSTYTGDGRLATDTDALGNVTGYTYDTATRTTRITNPDGGVLTRIFDDQGLLLTETDPLGHTTTHEYDPNQNETKQTNAIGEVTAATYDIKGNQISLTNAKGTRTIAYNDLSQPTTLTDRLGHVSTIEYDDHHVMQRFADEGGLRITFTNSEQGLPLTIDDVGGHRAYLSYDAAGNVTSRTDWLGRVTQMTYDEIGLKLSETTPRGATTHYAYYLSGLSKSAIDVNGYLHQYSYDQNGNTIIEGDSPGLQGQTIYTYNALNQMVQATHSPDGPTGSTTVSYARDFRGNPLSMTDENGHTTHYEYDLAGNLTKATFADGTSTTRTYDSLNRLSALTDERGNTTSYEYDPGCACSDRVTKVTDALGHATTTAYDANGRKSSTTDANGHTTSYVYDPRGQLIETDFPDGTSTQRSYDSRGRSISATDQTGATTAYGYDDQGQLTAITDPLGNITRYAYDLDGNLASATDANNHATTYEYDLLNRKTKRTLALGQVETFAYDFAGREIAHTDFRGKTTTMTYDSRNRMLTRTPDASLGEVAHTYFYSPTGMRTSASDATGTTRYTYDLRDRRLTKAAPAGTLTYSYDDVGNIASVRSSNTNGTSVDYVWDAANQLTSVTDNRVGGTTMATYTPTHRPATLRQANGVAATYSYDSMDRIGEIVWQRTTSPAGSPAFASWQYAYNERGQRRTATDITGRRSEYSYDSAARLVSETISGAEPSENGIISYVLDGLANRLSRTSNVSAVPSGSYSYDANEQLATDDHDASGNTTSSAGHTYAYDFENRLVSKDGGAVTLQYNCDGDRVAKTAGGITTQYLVDDLNPTGYLQVLEELVGGAVRARYTYGKTLISQTRDVSTTPATSYYGYDAHGSITFLTSTDGSVTDSYDYDAWGILVGRTGSTPNARLYTGEEFDPDLGLLNLRARQYNPSTGRFFTLDPLDLAASAGPRDARLAHAIAGLSQPQLRGTLDVVVPDRSALDERVLQAINWNRSFYANGDPVNRIDPTGRTEVGEYVSYVALYIAAFNLGIHIAEVYDIFAHGQTEAQYNHAAFGAAWSLNVEVGEFIAFGLAMPWLSLYVAIMGLAISALILFTEPSK